MKKYFIVPVGIFLSIIAMMNLITLLNKANTLVNVLAILGIVLVLYIAIKTKLFTNFKYKQ
jgi:threonine/homoserine/homoserine lactone efflux protein